MRPVDQAPTLDYRHLFCTSAHACLVGAPDLTIRAGNKAYADLVGMPLEKLIGQQFFEVLGTQLQDAGPELRASFMQALEIDYAQGFGMHVPEPLADAVKRVSS